MKVVQFYTGAILIVLVVGLHFGYLNFGGNPTQVPSNSTQTPNNSTLPANITSRPNATDTANQMFYAMFGSDPIWMVWSAIGVTACFRAVTDHQYHSHYDWGPSTDSYPSSTTGTETEDEPAPEDVAEAKSLQKQSVEILKCPHCGANLKFGSSSVTTCEYCNNEVRRKEN